MIKIKKLSNSFRYAVSGLYYVWKTQQNFKIHFLGFLVVTALSAWLKISFLEFSILLLVVLQVFLLEILNTVFEKFSDMLKPRIHDYVKYIKDITAGAVLLAAIFSVIIGFLIFFPYFLQKFS